MWELECSSQHWALREVLNQEKVVILQLGNFLKFSLGEVLMNHIGCVVCNTVFPFFHWKKIQNVIYVLVCSAWMVLWLLMEFAIRWLYGM